MSTIAWDKATDTELFTVGWQDEAATPYDRYLAQEELLRRIRKKRKPYRNNQQKIRRAMPRW